jgi:hypothetical protein
MLRMYLTHGTAVEIADATTVESTHVFRAGPSSLAIEGLVCRDAAGTTVAEFKLRDISGYAFAEPAEREPSTSQRRPFA